MARLILQTDGPGQQAFELRIGINRAGRADGCEVCLSHPSVSVLHCELELTAEGVRVRDLGSTNGTFLDGQRVTEAWLAPGQELSVGGVRFLIESTDAVIAIPQFERGEPPPAAPVFLEDGQAACPRHTDTAAVFKCSHCQELMCPACVRVLRVEHGRPHYHCHRCSHPAERLGAAGPKKKRGFLTRLQETVKLKFNHPRDGQK